MAELKMIYEPDSKSMVRIGLTNFKKVQVETLGFQTLGDKIKNILLGNMDFHADNRELEYDQDVGLFSDPEPDLDPSNGLMDKTDIFDVQKAEIDRINEAYSNQVTKTEVTPGEVQTQATVPNNDTVSNSDE